MKGYFLSKDLFFQPLWSMSTYRTYTSLSFASLLGDAKSFWFWAHALKPSYLGSHAKLKSNDCSVIYICHIPRSSAFFFLNIMLEYIILTPSYANLSYAMFSGQSWGRILGYCCRINSIWSIRSDILESLVKKYSRERPGRKHCFTVKWVVLKPNHSYLENSATSD